MVILLCESTLWKRSIRMAGKVSENQLKQQKAYDIEHTVHYCMKLNKKTDKDIIEWLAGKPSRQGAIKEAIRMKIDSEKMGCC